MLCCLTKIAEDRDYCVGVSILYSEPKVVRIPKYLHMHLDDYMGLCGSWSVQILPLSKTDSVGTGSKCLRHREVSVLKRVKFQLNDKKMV